MSASFPAVGDVLLPREGVVHDELPLPQQPHVVLSVAERRRVLAARCDPVLHRRHLSGLRVGGAVAGTRPRDVRLPEVLVRVDGSRPMTSKALVGPVRQIYFRDGSNQPYDQPRNTLDLRYALCTDHHPACDCREAMFAEDRAEFGATREAMDRAATTVLAGHRLYDYGDDLPPERRPPLGTPERLRLTYGDGPLACQCTGCQLVRACRALYVLTDEHGLVRGEP